MSGGSGERVSGDGAVGPWGSRASIVALPDGAGDGVERWDGGGGGLERAGAGEAAATVDLGDPRWSPGRGG